MPAASARVGAGMEVKLAETKPAVSAAAALAAALRTSGKIPEASGSIGAPARTLSAWRRLCRGEPDMTDLQSGFADPQCGGHTKQRNDHDGVMTLRINHADPAWASDQRCRLGDAAARARKPSNWSRPRPRPAQPRTVDPSARFVS